MSTKRDIAGKLVALAAGGTGGHMFPAEALAQELKRRGARILLVTDDRGARYAKEFPDDERFEISAASPSIGGPVAKAAAVMSLAGGFMKARSEFKRRKPAAAVGFGGYPSFAAMKAASVLKIPYGVHEQNGVLGRANRQLVANASFVAHAFPVLEKLPESAHTKLGDARLHEVGNPVRDAVNDLAGSTFTLPRDGAPVTVLVFGGSQGASLFSRVVPRAIARLPETVRKNLAIMHQARDAEAASVRAVYDEAGVVAEIAPFFSDLPERMARSHLVVARSGGATVTELSIIGRPSILVPLAIAMDDHQTGNARTLSQEGQNGAKAAILLPENDFTDEMMRAALEPLLAEPQRLADMAQAARGRVRQGAAEALADLVEEITVGERVAS